MTSAAAATGQAIRCGLLLGVQIALFPLVGLNAPIAHGLATALGDPWRVRDPVGARDLDGDKPGQTAALAMLPVLARFLRAELRTSRRREAGHGR